MNLLTEKLIPFVGTEHLKLYTALSDIKILLKENSINFFVETWANNECTIPMPWTIIHIDNAISLFFANNKLFKIVVFEKYTGNLDNGIRTGMPINTALEKDSRLHYDEWNEDYESDDYWIEKNIETNTISSISII